LYVGKVNTNVIFNMSKVLQIWKAKPNPAGKDKVLGTPKAEQLLGEWVDIKNTGTEPIRFSEMSLSHTLYDRHCNKTGRTEQYWSGGGDNSLSPGQVVRIHTGRASDEHLMNPKDKENRDWKGFANRDNFVLNNVCGDVISVTWRDASGVRWDTASYDRNQPEGEILHRQGSKLVVVAGY
jgi:hypothetical protein